VRVKLKNVGIIREADVSLEPGVNVIRGPSGSGKSTLVRAVEGAIYNDGGDSMVTSGESVSTTGIQYNGHVVIRRRDTNARDSKTIYKVDGSMLPKVGRVPLSEVTEAFRMGEVELSNDELRLNFVRQFGVPFLIGETSSKIFEFFVAGSDLPNVVKEMKQDQTVLNADIKAGQAVVDNLTKLIQSEQVVVDSLAGVPDLLTNILAVEKDAQRCSYLTVLIKTAHEAFTRVDKLQRVAQVVIPGLPDPYSYMDLCDLINGYGFILSDMAIAEKLVGRLDDQLSRIQSVPDFGSLRDLEVRVKVFSRVGEVKAKMTKAEAALVSVKAELEAVEMELSKFEVCPLCGSKLGEDSHVC